MANVREKLSGVSHRIWSLLLLSALADCSEAFDGTMEHIVNCLKKLDRGSRHCILLPSGYDKIHVSLLIFVCMSPLNTLALNTSVLSVKIRVVVN